MIREPLQQKLAWLAAFFAARQQPAWLVGGTLRDLIMGRTPGDLDIAVTGDGTELARTVADSTGGSFVVLDQDRGTGRIVYPAESPEAQPLTVDIVQLRAPTLEEDLRLRDFTINALALPLAALPDPATPSNLSSLIAATRDPCNGLHDIAAQQIRPCSPTSLHDDPIRIVRAFRLAATLDMTISPESEQAIRNEAPHLTRIAPERVRDELLKLLAIPSATPWLRFMDRTGVLTTIVPELEPARHCDQPIVHFLPVLEHMLETVACLEWLLADKSPPPASLPVAVQTYPDLPRLLPYADRLQAHFANPSSSGHPRLALFKLATLIHDNAKPQTKQPKPGGGVTFYGHQKIGASVAQTIARRLRFSRQETKYLSQMVYHHMRLGQLRAADETTPRAVARFLRDTRGASPDIILHDLADHLATQGPHLDRADWDHHLAWSGALLDALWQPPRQPTPPLVNGHDLMDVLGLSPGKQVGELLREVHEAQAAGEISTRQEALDLAQTKAQEA